MRRLPFRSGRAIGLVAAALSVSAAGLTAPSAFAETESLRTSSDSRSDEAAGKRPGDVAVTLVTGDVVRLTAPDAVGGYSVEAAPGRPAGAITSLTDPAGDLHVVPLDIANSPVGVDSRLFNVSALVRAGYGGDDAGIPIKVEVEPTSPLALPGAADLAQPDASGFARTTLTRAGAAILGAALAGGEAIPGVRAIALDATLDDIAERTARPYDPQRTDLVNVTVRLFDRAGEPFSEGSGRLYYVNLDDVGFYFEYRTISSETGSVTLSLPPGNYAFALQAQLPNDLGGDDLVEIDKPQVTITEDTEIILDGRTSTQIAVDVGESYDVADACLSTWRINDTGDDVYVNTCEKSMEGDRLFASPTQAPSIGDYEFYSRWILQGTRWYQLVFPEHGRVPDVLNYEVGPDEVGRVIADFPSYPGDDVQYYIHRYSYRPYESRSWARGYTVIGPERREEWLSASPTSWDAGVNWLEQDQKTYEPGQVVRETWYGQPIRPSSLNTPSTRAGDVMAWRFQSWADRDDHYLLGGGKRNEFKLYADGKLIRTMRGGYGEIRVTRGRVRYVARLDVAPLDRLSKRSHTTWTFESRTAPARGRALPLLEVDYDLGSNLRNEISLDSTLRFDVRHTGHSLTAWIPTFAVLARAGDGEWQELEVTHGDGGAWSAVLDLSGDVHSGDLISLRVSATDSDGSSIEQEIEEVAFAA